MEGHAPRGCGRNQVGGGGVRHRLLATLMWPRLSSSAGGGGGHARRNHSRRFAQRWAQDAIPELCGFHELAVKQTVRVRLQSPGWLCFITDVSSYSVERSRYSFISPMWSSVCSPSTTHRLQRSSP
ncbi:hypothetical protein JZ751_019347 [Albula glossodonta]|uniref:Uncharacterized protein n=1 Tax=Albula glossodonta TaxID=121402 RepID=A0A8T2N0D2_9TELE|nr:hypothetical protein JZ751_019347 [Albula glossodonta]